MDKKELIMVVKKDILFKDKYFQGFLPKNKFNYQDIILKNYEFMRRDLVEDNINYKQPISYFSIINEKLKQIFVYKRSSEIDEPRLKDKFSIGLGGHIEKSDSLSPLESSMIRELKQEVDLHNLYDNINPKLMGYINYDSDSVGKVHFGVFYLIKTDSEIIFPKDKEIERGTLLSIKKLEKLSDNFEFWSQIVYPEIKKYMKNLS